MTKDVCKHFSSQGPYLHSINAKLLANIIILHKFVVFSSVLSQLGEYNDTVFFIFTQAYILEGSSDEIDITKARSDHFCMFFRQNQSIQHQKWWCYQDFRYYKFV